MFSNAAQLSSQLLRYKRPSLISPAARILHAAALGSDAEQARAVLQYQRGSGTSLYDGRHAAAHASAQSWCIHQHALQVRGLCSKPAHAAANSGAIPSASTSTSSGSSAQQPVAEAASASTPPATPKSASKKPWGSSATGLGLFGLAGLFGQRTMLVVFSKKAVYGLFSILSIKKLLFLPAWIWVICASAGVSLSLWFTSLQAPVTGRRQSFLTTRPQEAELGALAVQTMQAQGQLEPVSERDKAARRAQALGTRVKHALALLEDEPEARRREWLVEDWQFDVVNSDNSLAFSVPPNRIFISRRMLGLLRTDDEVAFVLAHELAHLIARHAGENITRESYWLYVTGLLKDWLGIEAGENVVSLFLQLPYQRKQEYEADLIAMTLLSKACFNIGAGIQAFEHLQVVARESDTKAWLQHWSSHPCMQARVDTMRKVLPKILEGSPCRYHDDLLRSMSRLGHAGA